MKTVVIFLIFLGWIFPQDCIFAQEIQDFPRDTTYTLWSTTEKLRNDYPFIKPVNEFLYTDVLSEREIAYHSIGGRNLHLDIFRPASQDLQKHSCIICIHGGGWASGNKSLLIPMAQKLASNGFVTATIEYRLSPEAFYPAGVIDVKTAIRWLKGNASEYKIDTNQMVILGTSAGATIATLVGNTPGHPLYTSPNSETLYTSDRVQAIVNIDGIVDFTDPAESGKDHDPAKPSAATRWFGATYKENPEKWVEASPLTYTGPHSPPTLFINSAVPRFHAGRDPYLEILETFGIYYQVETIPDSPHSFWLFDPWFDPAIGYIIKFVNAVLKGICI